VRQPAGGNLDESRCAWNGTSQEFLRGPKKTARRMTGLGLSLIGEKQYFGEAQYGYAYSNAGEQDSWRQLPD
jgi:hypothetical protein